MRARLDLTPLPAMPAPDLDAQQRAVVAHREGPLLVLAGPGTGKTTTIVESVVARLAEGEDPESVLVLTFGRRAAQELRDRIAARLGGGLLPQVATFHSFAYGLLRASASSEEYSDPPRLLSGAEEDQRIRELIRGTVEDGSVDWPEDLSEALGTHGFAVEVRTMIARMRERDISPSRLRRLAAQVGRPEWVAVADIAAQEEDVMVLENVLDYAELMRRAVLRASEPEVREVLHRRIRSIYVDEFQDTDPLQVHLLRRIAGPRCSVVAVGDPDQAIYAFRGADVRGILDFPHSFLAEDGSSAEVVALRSVRRYAAAIASAARAALAPAALPGLPAQTQREHRNPFVPDDPAETTPVRVLSCPSITVRDARVAEQILAAHVHHGLAWRDMAVLVRTSDDLIGIERALTLAGVPAAVTVDEVPLHAESAVAQLLAVIDIAAHPERARPERVIDLLAGPIGRVDPSAMRRFGRELRDARRSTGAPVLAGRELIAEAIMGAEPLPSTIEPTSPLAQAVQRVRSVLADVSALIESGAAVGDVLWAAWTGGEPGHGWPQRLRDQALGGSSMAHHDLDAVMALFATAERISERYHGVYGVSAFLATLRDQAIPAEAIADTNTYRDPDVVRIMTVHRAKGLQWPRVWVVGLEEGRWPNLRPRGSLLGVQELQEAGDAQSRGDSVAALVREERNLLYVACTRAQDRLTLMCVDSGDAGDERPSRFVDDLVRVGFPVEPASTSVESIASWSALVAELRVILADTTAPETAHRQAAALLAAMARAKDATGTPCAPGADPANWWGIRALSVGPVPLRDPNEPIALSGSSLDALRECSMKWFLDHEVHAETMRGSGTAFGSIVHAVADHVAKGDIPEDIEAMDAYIDRVWSAVEFEAAWKSRSERAEARRCLERFLRYHQGRIRELVDTERFLATEIEVPLSDGGTDTVSIRGYLDRIERNDNSELVAIDLKTTTAVPTKAQTAEHGQLGLYQLLLREEPEFDAPIGGAALVQLRKDAGASDPAPKEQFQEPLGVEGERTWIEDALAQAVDTIRSEDIVARVGKQCSYCTFQRVCPAKNQVLSVIDLGLPGDIADVDRTKR